MKSLGRKFLALAVIAMLVFSIVPSLADGTVSVKASKSSITVGDSVTVTITFGGGDTYIAGAMASVSYDSKILKFVSGPDGANISNGKGTIVLETTSTSKTTLSIALKFTGLAAGSTKVSVSGTDIVDWDKQTIGTPSGSKTITVTTKEETKPDDKKEDDKKEDPKKEDTPKEPTDIEQAIKVTVNGEERYLWRSLKNVKVPEHFEAKTVVYNGEQIQAANNPGLDLNLLYFTDAKGANGEFLVYNGFEDFAKLIKFSANGTEYVSFAKPDDVTLPEGYTKRTETILETEGVDVYSSISDEDYYYLYLGNLTTGNKGLYQLDRKENTVQRANRPLIDAKIELENMPEEPVIPEPSVVPEPSESVIEEPVEEPEEKGLVERILADDGIMLTIIGIAGGSLILIAIMASALIISKKKRKQQVKAEKARRAAEEKKAQEAQEETEETEPEETEAVEEAEEISEGVSEEADEEVSETAETAEEAAEDTTEETVETETSEE